MSAFQTVRFGELQYAERDVLTLQDGLVGLPQLKRWILLDMGPGLPLKWLQSLDDGGFGVPVTTPDFFVTDYAPCYPGAVAGELGGDPEQIVTLIITTVYPGGARLTGNLAAPLIVQPATRLGAQAILDDTRWSLRQEMDYVRFGLAAQSGDAPVAGLQAAPVEGERQEIAL